MHTTIIDQQQLVYIHKRQSESRDNLIGGVRCFRFVSNSNETRMNANEKHKKKHRHSSPEIRPVFRSAVMLCHAGS